MAKKTDAKEQEKDLDLSFIEKDTFLQDLFKSVKNIKIDDSTLTEVAGYTVVDKSTFPDLIPSTKTAMKLAEEIARTQSYRDRVIGCLLSFLFVKRQLERYKIKAVSHLWTNYYDILSNFKTEGIRQTIASEMIMPVTKKISEIERAVEVCEQSKENLKFTSYALKEIKDLLVLAIQAKQEQKKFVK